MVLGSQSVKAGSKDEPLECVIATPFSLSAWECTWTRLGATRMPFGVH